MICKYGGDADTNASVAGALWGARNGYEKLPREWLIEMPHRAFLDDKVEQFITKITTK